MKEINALTHSSTEQAPWLFDWLLSHDPSSDTAHDWPVSMASWWEKYLHSATLFPATALRPIDRAIIGGALAGRVAHAFCSGYHNALQRLFPGLDDQRRAALLVTERGGKSPRDIATRLTAHQEHWLLNGEKSYVSGGSAAQQLLVLAASGETAEGRRQLKIVRLSSQQAGVSIEDLPAAAWMPEFRHGHARLQQVVVRAEDLLPGDGFADYTRPFATLESGFIFAALASHLFRLATVHRWPLAQRQSLLFLIMAYRSISDLDPRQPATEILLQGCHDQAVAIIEQCAPCLGQLPGELSAAWQRDSGILRMAKGTLQRSAKAWERFGHSS